MWLRPPGSPYDAAGGWRKARRVAGMDAGQFFARAGCPVEKPRTPPAHLEGRRPVRRVIRGALSFGYFSLGKQRKVTRPPAGGRKPAAGEQAGDHAKTKERGSGFSPARRAKRTERHIQSQAKLAPHTERATPLTDAPSYSPPPRQDQLLPPHRQSHPSPATAPATRTCAGIRPSPVWLLRCW